MGIIFSNNIHIQLHNHGQYSVLDGMCRPEQMVQRCHELAVGSIGLTDHGTMAGVYKFWKACTEGDIKPIIGQEFYIANPDDIDADSPEAKTKTGSVTNHHLCLFAMNQEGYRNLCRLSSWGWLYGMYYKPRIDLRRLREWNGGIICSTACIMGKIGESLSPKKGPLLELKQIDELAFWEQATDRALQAIDAYHEIFGDRFYLEVMNHNLPEEQVMNQFIIAQSIKQGIPVIATNDAHYVWADQGTSDDYMLQIKTAGYKTKEQKDDENQTSGGMKMSSHDYYLKSRDEMAALFADYPDFVDHSWELAERCELVSPVLSKKMYPVFQHAPQYESPYDQLEQMVWDNLRIRQQFDEAIDTTEYNDRLAYELDIIKKKDFADVFLLMWDICKYADEQGIVHGPGRGSGSSSLVLWLLNVTHLDPLKEKLVFERFIDPERNEIPDIDTDWEPDRRGEILDYIRARYGGSERVVQIQAFGTLGPRQVLNDLSRVATMELGETDPRVYLIKKMAQRVTTEPYVRDESGTVIPVSLHWAYETDQGDPTRGEESLAKLIASDSYAQKMWKCALDMERAPRQTSTHAGGIVITDGPAWDSIPIQKATGGQLVVTQFDMFDLEAVGVGKLDILGLNNLGVIAEATGHIRKVPGWENFNIRNIGLDDEQVYDFISNGWTKGVFQMEKDSFTKCVMEVQPRTFQELSDIIALFRPGPLGDPNSDDISLKDDYCARKHGEAAVIWGIGNDNKFIRHVHPDMRPILQDTLGVIIYQEQVMRIASEMVGLTRTEGYKIIKAISKKKKDVLVSWQDKFIESAIARGYDRKWVEDLWTAIEKFAGYSFNMAHAKSYAVITYWTAWLSLYFPKEFFCAYLNASDRGSKKAGEQNKKDIYLAECQRRGIQVLVPDVNESSFDMTVTPSGIRYGLKSIKGIANSAQYIIDERNTNGPYTSFDNFEDRIPAKKVNKAMKQALKDSGAFDSTQPDMRSYMTPQQKATAEAKLLGQVFDMGAVIMARRAYQSGIARPINQMGEAGGSCAVAGMVTSVSERTAHASGKTFGVGTIRDETGTAQFVCFQPVWDNIKMIMSKGSIWVLSGAIDQYGTDQQIKIFQAVRM